MNKFQKYIALLIGFFLFLFLIYKAAIKKTIKAKENLIELQREKQVLDNASEKIQYLQEKNNYLNATLKENDISIFNSFQQTLLKKIIDFSITHSIDIINFNEPHTIREHKAIKETYIFRVIASYNNVLKLINYLEQQQLGKLISINFEKKKNYKTGKEFLTTEIYLQKIKT
ncbi:hypothetical protein [Tenacibaculum maritimum]|uniref:hypothetical protein n=1 Tax=Tenacibaculum maritimum TaxID=107401 RepID=UPI0012E3FD1F|nr:hypothetical protein [Tenacibaculum maritimum]CAA0140995.1 conserved hypothetical protein [Tenacibaculum maritimum]CAA0165488.1 conserved hypothetical protein [Tenacibaculum maritimum]CAA0247412.1 putative bacterial general secretion pathway protein [Tenacibaculum maritimum]CAA0248946.1 conserved hypothetical protein [Tenacibaculum maritimum]CAA0251387.1 conserved hypothetical protein [Tenacibaculum maritimum]